MKNKLRSDYLLFSESNTRFIVEVKKEKQKEFETLLKNQNCPFNQIGTVTSDRLTIKHNGKELINEKITTLEKTWKETLHHYMG